MRSIVTGYAIMFMCVITFISMANIQLNANAAIEIEYAANEAVYESMITLQERGGEISTDEQLQKEFIQDAGIMLHGNQEK